MSVSAYCGVSSFVSAVCISGSAVTASLLTFSIVTLGPGSAAAAGSAKPMTTARVRTSASSCFSFFFIPLFKWGKQYYAVSNCCHTIYAIDAELGKAIEHGESVTLREEDLTIAGMGQAQEMHCPDCGYLLSQEYAYCPKCGRKIH